MRTQLQEDKNWKFRKMFAIEFGVTTILLVVRIGYQKNIEG